MGSQEKGPYSPSSYPLLFIMGPHSINEHSAVFLVNPVNKAVMDIDPPGIKPLQVTDQFLVGWIVRKRIFFQDIQKHIGFFCKPECFNLMASLLASLLKNNSRLTRDAF